MTEESNLTTPDGRSLHVYDSGSLVGGTPRATVVWHHGTPQLGWLPDTVIEPAAAMGIRLLAYDRPGYGSSTEQPGRNVASAALDTAFITNTLGVDRFAAIGASGGGPHALGCAALIPGRAVAIAVFASLAPFDADGIDDWYAGMAPGGIEELRPATHGRDAIAAYIATDPEFDESLFIAADFAALGGGLSWLGSNAGRALASGTAGLVDDDVAYVTPWGFALADIRAPVLIRHGESDRTVPVSHGRWLADHLPSAELAVRSGEGHVSVLGELDAALQWCAQQVSST